jgi:hypothetical protein
MLSSHFLKQFSRALKIIIFGMLNLKSKMNKLILSYFFNFYKGYTENSSSNFEYKFYSLASVFVLSFTMFSSFVSIVLIFNLFINSIIPVNKDYLYVYLIVFILFTYYYIFIINKISNKMCIPENYGIKISRKSKFFSYSFLVINFLITVLIAKYIK